MDDHKFKVACIVDPKFAIKNHSSADKESIDIGFAFACGHGYLKLAKKLFKSYPQLDVSNHTECAFRLACRNGHYDIVKWLLKIDIKYDKQINIHVYNNYSFRKACKYGHYKIIKFLIKYDECYIRDKNDYAFRLACKNGHLHIAKFLLDKDKSIDIFAKGFHAYIGACINGHMDLVRWLYELAVLKSNNDVTKMWHMNHFVFPNVCRNGHIDIAQYIYYKHSNFDISCNKDFAFIYSCQNNHIKLAIWLCNLSNKYELDIDFDNKRITYFQCHEFPITKKYIHYKDVNI